MNTSIEQDRSDEFLYDSCIESIEALAAEALPKNIKITLALIGIVLAIPTVLLNILVLVAMIRRKRLQSTSNVFLGGLAVTDFITGLVLLPSFISIYLIDTPRNNCSLINATTVFALATMLSTFSSMILLATDRYFAIFKPFIYRKASNSKSKFIRIVICHILFSFAISMGSMFTPKKIVFNVTAMVLLFITLSWSIYVHTRSYFLSKRLRKTDERQSRVTGPAIISQERNKRIRRTVFLMLVALCCCFFPFLAGLVMLSVHRNKTFTQHYYPLALLLLMTNSLLNPLIYCWNMKDIRREITALFVSDGQHAAPTSSRCNHAIDLEESSTKSSARSDTSQPGKLTFK